MLDGYWLFADADTALSRDVARRDEFISLFKHACLLQRHVTLSDQMIVASPNFRWAYHADPDFRELVLSDIVQVAYTHQRGSRHEGTMDLVEVMKFHLRFNLGAPDIKEFFTEPASESYLIAIQGKPAHTHGEFSPSLRDPLFSANVIDQLGCDYLKRNLGVHAVLFADLVLAQQQAFAKADTPLGIVNFVRSQECWNYDTIVDAFFNRLPGGVPSETLAAYEGAIYRFAKSLLTRAESDLMKLDPILPPEDQAYVEVLHDTTVEHMVETGEFVGHKVHELSTELDDVQIYRRIDFQTIVEMRRLDEAHALFEAAAPGPRPPLLSERDAVLYEQRVSERFGDALVAYRRRIERELRSKFAHAAKSSLERTTRIKIAQIMRVGAYDRNGKPRKFASTVVEYGIAGLSGHLGPDVALALRFLNTMLVPHLAKADRFLADLTAERVKSMTIEALTKQTGQTQMSAHVAVPNDRRMRANGFTVYTQQNRSD